MSDATPTSPTTGKRRVLMAHRVASAWLTQAAKPEFRLEVFHQSPGDIRKVVRLLQGHRDNKIVVSNVPKIPDLGIRESKDCLGSCVVWSQNREGVMAIQAWLEQMGFETSGVW